MRGRLSAVLMVCSLLSPAGWARAQEAMDVAPTPLMTAPVAAGKGGESVAAEGAARRAMQMGFSGVAVGLYQMLVEAGETPAERDRLRLNQIMALLEDDQMNRAAEVLAAMETAGGPRAALRRGLIAMARGQDDAAETAINGVKVADLPAVERPWFHYLIGSIADAGNESQLARNAYAAAIAQATSAFQRARFELADFRSRWRVTEPKEAEAEALKKQADNFIGQRVGYDAAKQYAAVLAALGRKSEAVIYLQSHLLALPAAELQMKDDFRLLLGIIAGAKDGVGRNALFRLLADGVDREKQRIGLRLLAQASSGNEALRVELRNELSRLLNQGTPHRIEQDLLLYRAQLAPSAEVKTRDALALLERFPASDLRPAALGILVSAAWEDGRYRAAAGYAAQAQRELLTEDREIRSQLGLLQAEAFFRGGDFRSAADAYAAVLESPPSGVQTGVVVFQEVLSRIAAGQLTEAANRIDALATDPRLDTVNRWRSEWNLARALQVADRDLEAYARVNGLMAEDVGATALPSDLSVRVGWLQARLALDAQQPEKTLDVAPKLRERLGGVDDALRVEVASSLRLLEAEANFAMGHSAPALAVLQQLRAEFPNSDAAVYSYIEEANSHAVQGQLVEAQTLLTLLVEKYGTNRYAPYALYQSALMAEGRREEIYLEEAIRKIEDLVTKYPKSELVFYARFKEGDIFRKLGQWGPARQVYETIINDFPQHVDVVAAQMALADTLAAQAGSDATLHDSAAAIYERLRDLVTAPVELRIEAGLKAGNALERRNLPERAAELWWQVVDQFLLKNDTPENLGTKGRYWLARILAKLGDVFESQQRLEEARNAYALMRDRGLPQAEWAAAQLMRLGVTTEGNVESTSGR